MSLNVPAGVKMFGVHVVPTPAQVATGIPAWTNLFIDWDWVGWVKKQIDYAVGNGIGGNCIGLIGCMDGVHAGTISQATVNSRFVQIAAYCASLGVYFYPKFCGFNQMAGVTNAECATYILSVLNALTPYSNVISCDLVTEADNWNDGSGAGIQAVADRCNAIYTLVKAGTSLQCTFSSTLDWSGAPAKTWAARIAAGVDYWDFHPYEFNGWASPLVLADGNYWFTNYATKGILFGEGGVRQSRTIEQQNAFLRGLGMVMRTGDVRYLGWLLWAAQDQDVVDTNQYGLHNASWNQRQNIANILRQFTGRSIIHANSGIY